MITRIRVVTGNSSISPGDSTVKRLSLLDMASDIHDILNSVVYAICMQSNDLKA